MKDNPLNTLINNIKLASIMSPLIEAIEINKRTEGVPGLTASELFKAVIETGTEICENLEKDKKNSDVQKDSTDLVFLTLALCIRNSTVLYNCPNLNMVREEVIRLLKDNAPAISSLDFTNRNTLSSAALISLSHLHMPTILFHSNLYTSGLIDLDKMNELNIKCSEKITQVYAEALKTLCINDDSLKCSLAYVLADSGAKMLNEYHLKIIKSKSSLFDYISEPETVLTKIINAIQGGWVILSEVTQDGMKALSR